MAMKRRPASKSNGRAKPVMAKAGVTRNRDRRYGCGGKLKSK